MTPSNGEGIQGHSALYHPSPNSSLSLLVRELEVRLGAVSEEALGSDQQGEVPREHLFRVQEQTQSSAAKLLMIYMWRIFKQQYHIGMEAMKELEI